MPHAVIFWGNGSPSDTQLIDSLSKAGFPAVLVQNIESCVSKASEQKPFALFVAASDSESELEQRVRALESAKSLFSIPLVLITQAPTSRVSVLSEKYRKFIPARVPCRFDSLALQVQLFFPPGREPVAELEPQSADLEKPPSDPALLRRGFGGSILAQGSDELTFEDEHLLPKHPRREKLSELLEEFSQEDPWLAVHARRVTYVSSAIACSLNVDKKRDDNIRTAGLLLNWGILKEFPFAIRRDLSQIRSKEQLGEIVQGIQQSAQLIRQELGDTQAAKVVFNIANLMLPDAQSGNEQTLVDAQCTLVSEIADRACWNKGFWNPRGAYTALRAIENRSLFSINEQIVTAATRVLVEAVAAGPAKRDLLLPSKITEASEADEQNASLPVENKTAEDNSGLRVEIFNLRPGMRLAQPIRNAQGAVLFPQDTDLDYDAIRRLWHLSIVSPIRKPLAVKMGQPE